MVDFCKILTIPFRSFLQSKTIPHTVGKTFTTPSASDMYNTKPTDFASDAKDSSRDRIKAEMKAKHRQLHTQLAQPVLRPVVALPSPVVALVRTENLSPLPSDKKCSAKKTLVDEFVNYEITDAEPESDSDESETSRESNHKAPVRKPVPDWARSHNLRMALERQYSPDYPIDPDELLGEVETCNLEAIFGKKSSKYRRRNSSGDWTKHRVTADEKLAYKQAVM